MPSRPHCPKTHTLQAPPPSSKHHRNQLARKIIRHLQPQGKVRRFFRRSLVPRSSAFRPQQIRQNLISLSCWARLTSPLTAWWARARCSRKRAGLRRAARSTRGRYPKDKLRRVNSGLVWGDRACRKIPQSANYTNSALTATLTASIQH